RMNVTAMGTLRRCVPLDIQQTKYCRGSEAAAPVKADRSSVAGFNYGTESSDRDSRGSNAADRRAKDMVRFSEKTVLDMELQQNDDSTKSHHARARAVST